MSHVAAPGPVRRVIGERAPVRPIQSVTGGKSRGGPAIISADPVRIFQIYYEPWHVELLDPTFIPFDNCGKPDELLEFAVFERLAAASATDGAMLWSALSWRFAEKTGLSGAGLKAAIAADPGHDVYYCNPFPQHEALYHNLWTQGETAHPGLIELTRALLEAAGLPGGEVDAIEPSVAYSTANFFIGTPRFWNTYLPFVRGALDRADAALSDEIKATLHSSAADARGVHGGVSYLPFVVERLFALFMRTEGRNLSACQLSLPDVEARLDVHLKLLREMKDAAHHARSPWLAACWVNYRNLYLKQQHGSAWCHKHLRAVTPTKIDFA